MLKEFSSSVSERIRQFKINLFRKGYRKKVTSDMIEISFVHAYSNNAESRLDFNFYKDSVIKKLKPILKKFLINTAQTTNVFDFNIRISFSPIKNSKLATQEFQFWFDLPVNNYQYGNFLLKLPDGSFTNLLFNYKPNENAINKKDELNRKTKKFIKILNKISSKDIYLHIYSGIFSPNDFLKERVNNVGQNNELLSPEATKLEYDISVYYKYLHDNNFVVRDFIFNKVLMLNFIIYKDITWTLGHFDYRKGSFDNFDTYQLNYNEKWELLTQFAKCQCVESVVLEQEITKDNYDETIEVMKALAY